MNSIKISVIVPVYNTGRYLERCLNSIMAQSFQEIEIIIINDCSTDDSLEIIKKYINDDKRAILINKEKNEGVSSARNTGIKIATGKYVQYIDGDDWVEKDFLKNMYEFAEKENLDIVVSDYCEDYFDGRKKIKRGKKKSEKIIFDSKEYLKDFFYNGDAPAMWNKLFKTSLYKENSIFCPLGISLGEDLVTTSKLIYFSKKIGYSRKVFYHYRQNPQSMINTLNGVTKCQIFKCFDLLNDFFKEQNENFEDLLYRNSIYHLKNFLSFKPVFNNEEYMEGYKNFLLLISDKRFDENTDILNRIMLFFIKIFKFFPYKITFLFLNKILILLKRIRKIFI